MIRVQYTLESVESVEWQERLIWLQRVADGDCRRALVDMEGTRAWEGTLGLSLLGREGRASKQASKAKQRAGARQAKQLNAPDQLAGGSHDTTGHDATQPP